MGTLRELQAHDKSVHLLVTNSNLVEIYVYDALKEVCGANRESIYEINTRADFKEMLEMMSMQPYLAEKWLFILDYSKLKGITKQYKGIFESETSCFLVKVKNYADFKEFKGMCPKVNDLYLSLIRSNDVMFLFSKYSIAPKLVDFIAKSYARDPEKVFLLAKELDNGIEIENQKDIVRICGASSGTVIRFVMLLLASPPKTEKGEARVYKKRIQMAEELIELYNLSSFKNFLTATVKDMLDIKTLYMQGIIYNKIAGLPEIYSKDSEGNQVLVYDEKRLSKYNMYFRSITEDISYSSLMYLYTKLKESGVWRTKANMLQFIYDYYGGLKDAVTC